MSCMWVKSCTRVSLGVLWYSSPLCSVPMLARSPLPSVFDEKCTNNTSGDANAAHDGDTHHALPGDLVVDELAQVGGLQVGGLEVQQRLVEAAGLAVVAELVVAKSDIVQALAAAFGRLAVDFGEEADAELLLIAVGRFDEALPTLARFTCSWVEVLTHA